MIRSIKDFHYLSGYVIVVFTFIALTFPSNFAFATLIFTFGILPFLEFYFPNSQENLSEEKYEHIVKQSRFDYFLWLSIPFQWGVLIYYLTLISKNEYSILQLLGMTSAVGICSGVIGINIAHELGHRKNLIEQWMAQFLLLSSLYMHFFIEHNRGHHRFVATPLDPATAKLGENVYVFIPKSIIGGYVSAWKIQRSLLKKNGISFWNIKNRMLLFQVIQILLLISIQFSFGWKAMFLFIATACIGIILLEVINYIEHYGLTRNQIHQGIYEKVLPSHSWNSNHFLGRIMLFELTRHADHHYKASKKYQTLKHYDDCPQLPTGYPGMMLLSLIPPIWFRVMDPKVKAIQKRSSSSYNIS